MGYETCMQADIVALLRLFGDHVPDTETHAWVLDLAADTSQWRKGHDVFNRVRKRTLWAITSRDRIKESQYCFEEVCLKSLYNETCPSDPFDSCSPYWIIKNALALARQIGLPVQDVADVVAPRTPG